MPNKSELHLIVPGLCGPLAETHTLKKNRDFNAWLKRLARAEQSASQANTDAVIATIINLKLDNEFPSAALSLFANGMYDTDKHYMCADPVHLRADLSQAVLTSSEDLAINKRESAELRETLNQHFQQDQIKIISIDNKQWFVASNNIIAMKTTALVEAVGRNINFILPEGQDSTRWKQVLTEAQMLMHTHEVNTDREIAGVATINSLWFHGCGDLPDITEYKHSQHKISSICSSHNVLKGVANLVESEYLLLPESAGDYIEQLSHRELLKLENNSKNILHLSTLEHLVNYSDGSVWLEELLVLLEHWIYPILKMANKNNISVILYSCAGKQYTFSKYDVLKVWKQAVLEQHVTHF